MPIDEMLVGDGISAVSTSIEIVSDVVIGGNAGGLVFLQVELPVTGEWIDVTNQSGAYSVMTPDIGLNYRFRASNVANPIGVYFGP